MADLTVSADVDSMLSAANAGAIRTAIGIGTGDLVTFLAGVLSGQSLTGSQATSLMSISTTWNTTGTPTAFLVNVTDTASNAASLLMDLRVGGTSRFSICKDGVIVPGSILSASNVITTATGRFGTLNIGGTDVVLERDAANTLALRNSTNAQTFNLYNTYTDASNYERGCLKWSSNVLEVFTEAAGTGSNRELKLNSSAGVSIYKGATAYLDTGSYNMINMRRTTRFYAPLLPHSAGLDLGSSAVSFRDIYLAPSTSLTPANNGDLCIEATSNTALTFKYKGSDGTVRSGSITLS